MTRVACVDVGSTFTKGVLVETGPETRVVAAAAVATTVGASGEDVLDGVAAVRERLGPDDELLASSSAGGGLRLAVVGYERVVTAEAGARVALSAGARIVHVATGPLRRPDVAALHADRPDLVLLVGGTDGGNAEVLLHNAAALARGRRVPVVLAGNASARDEAVALLAVRGRPVLTADNVLPEIGRLEPTSARAAIRDAFLRHVIGGKGLTRRPARFQAMVRAATPDAVLAGVESLAAVAGDVLVVDVGGATTDVYSVLDPARLDAADTGDVAGTPIALRTVEGDLGVRWSAPGVLGAAVAERLVAGEEAQRLAAVAADRQGDPARLARSPAERADDLTLARLAVTVALRRHGRSGRDLRRVGLVVGSGGVLRHADAAGRAAVLASATSDAGGGWRVPERARVVVDTANLLGAAGLLGPGHPGAAAALVGCLTR